MQQRDGSTLRLFPGDILGRMCSYFNFMASCDVSRAVMNPWCLPVEIRRQESKTFLETERQRGLQESDSGVTGVGGVVGVVGLIAEFW